VKVTEENMADVDGVSVTSIKTESLTTVAVWLDLHKMLLQNLTFMYFGNHDLSSVTNMNTQSVPLYSVCLLPVLVA
jgi:hypothetical protein